MNDNDAFETLNQALDKYTSLMKAAQESPEGIGLRNTRNEMADFLTSVAKGDDIGLILAIERRFLADSLVRNLDDKENAKFFKSALAQLDKAEECLSWVLDPEKYRDVDQSHGSKNRKGQVPNDAVRQFFAAQLAHLNALAKLWMEEEQMKIVLERRRMIRRGEKLYAIQQHRALGLEPSEQTTSQGRK